MIPLDEHHTAPMMAEHEIALITTLLSYYPDGHVLEWGCGNSTIYFPTHAHVGHWTSIEHDVEFVQYVSERVDAKKVSVWHIPESETYYRCVSQQKGRYDFILIDGRLRKECLDVAMSIAHKGTAVILHDAGREEYQTWMQRYPYKVLSQGEIPDGAWFKHRGIAQFIP